MALVFPSQPQTVGTPYEAPNGVTYIWDGVKWNASGTPGTGNFNLGNLYVIDQTIAGLNAENPIVLSGNVEVDSIAIGGNIDVSGSTTVVDIDASGNILATGDLATSGNITALGNLTINSTDITAYDSNLYIDGTRLRLADEPISSGNYVFDGDNIQMPLVARLNSGGVGVTNSAEFGTDVVINGSNEVSSSEIYMGAGTAESRAIVDDQSRGLMYLGVENVGEGKFAGIVARDPNTDGSQYSPGLDQNGLPTIGLGNNSYVVAVGVMNDGFTINGLYADEDKVLLANGAHVWKLDQTGDMYVPEQIRNKTNNRAVWDNEVPRDIADLTDYNMLLGVNSSTLDINIDGGGAYAIYEGTLVRADGGFSGSRWGVNTTVFDGVLGAGGGYTNTLNGGGA